MRAAYFKRFGADFRWSDAPAIYLDISAINCYTNISSCGDDRDRSAEAARLARHHAGGEANRASAAAARPARARIGPPSGPPPAASRQRSACAPAAPEPPGV